MMIIGMPGRSRAPDGTIIVYLIGVDDVFYGVRAAGTFVEREFYVYHAPGENRKNAGEETTFVKGQTPKKSCH